MKSGQTERNDRIMARRSERLTTDRAVPPSGSARLACAMVVVLVVGLLQGGSGAAQVAPPESPVHVHPEGHDDLTGSDVTRRASDGLFRNLIINVEVSDAGFRPSAVFVPSGRPVQLVLHGRDRTEHHYKVVGLVPDELFWMAAPPITIGEDISDDEHNHHNREFVRSRDASPSGIRPTGNEVHGYVSPLETVDVVLFSTTRVGTFEVRCDLHAETVGRLVVFEAEQQPTGLMSAAGGAQGVVRDPLSVALSRDLGTLDLPGTPAVFVEATYAPPEYLTQLLGGPVVMPTLLEPDQFVAIVLTEGVHTGRLPARGESPDLYLDGKPLSLIDSKVTTELPHHRATLYRFARDDAFGTKGQVMTLHLAPGHEATWDLSSSDTGLWFIASVGFAGFGFVGWLVWTVAGRARRSKRMRLEAA